MAQRQVALCRRLLAGQCDNRADLLGRECRRRARTRCVSQAFSDRHGFGRAAPASQPVAHSLRPDAKLARALANPGPRRRQQNHLGTFRQLPWRGVGTNQTAQHPLLRRSRHKRFSRQTRHRGLSESRDEQTIRHATPTVLLTPPNRVPWAQSTQFPSNCGNLNSPPLAMESPLSACGTRQMIKGAIVAVTAYVMSSVRSRTEPSGSRSP